MTTALEIAKQLVDGSTLPSKSILEKLKQVYVANLEQEFFSQIGKHLFNQMDEKDRAELIAFQDAQLAKTYLEQEALIKEVRFDSEIGRALSEWDDLLEFQYGRMMYAAGGVQ